MGLDILEGSSGTGVRGSAPCRGELDSAKVDGVTTDIEEVVIEREAKGEDRSVEDRGHDVGDEARNEEGVKAPEDSSVTDNIKGGGVIDGTDCGSGGRGGDAEETDAE